MIETTRFSGITKMHKNQIRATGILGVTKGSPLDKMVRVVITTSIKERFPLTTGEWSGSITFKGKVRDGKTKRTVEVELLNFTQKEN